MKLFNTIFIYVEKIRHYIRNILEESFNDPEKFKNRDVISWDDLPNTIYHVTTNKQAVLSSGYLKAMKGFDSGGMGGTESHGISFVTDKTVAKNIYDELSTINKANNIETMDDAYKFIEEIEDVDRKEFVKGQFDHTIRIYENPITTILEALRITRFSYRFNGKPFHGIIVFFEKNIKDKDIGIISVDKNNISKDTKIIKGVDVDLGEIRVLDDVKI